MAIAILCKDCSMDCNNEAILQTALSITIIKYSSMTLLTFANIKIRSLSLLVKLII